MLLWEKEKERREITPREKARETPRGRREKLEMDKYQEGEERNWRWISTKREKREIKKKIKKDLLNLKK